MGFIGAQHEGDALLTWLGQQPAMSNTRYAQGLSELTDVVRGVRSLGVPESAFKVDLSIARGLGYYTGTVYETQLLDHPDLGSVCSGGRYDDLASHFTNEKLPGVGISIGLTRLVLGLLDRKVLTPGAQTPTRALVTTLDAARLSDYLAIAASLRAQGVPTEVFLERKPVGDQLKYAARKGIPMAVIAGSDEFGAGVVKVKHLATGTEETVATAALAAYVAQHAA
jgi:histidyl-tRNA synthetase